jgi:hypothetical protein
MSRTLSLSEIAQRLSRRLGRGDSFTCKRSLAIGYNRGFGDEEIDVIAG